MLDIIQSFIVSPIHIGQVELPISPFDFFIRLLLPIIAYGVIARFFSRLFARIESIPFWNAPNRKRVLVLLRRLIKLFLFAATLWMIYLFFRSETKSLLQSILSVLSQPIVSTGQVQLTILSLLLIIPIFYLANTLSKSIHRMLESRILPHILDSKEVRFTAANTVRYILMGLFVIFGLSMIGINLSSITLLIGVLGVGIGFGLQGTVENLFAGIVIIATRPIKVGDRIRMDEHLGDVKRIALLHTVVATVENETLIIPNKLLVSNVVHNTTHDMDESISLFLRFQVHYDSDLEQVRSVLHGILMENPYDAKDKRYQPTVYLYSFDASGITFSIACRIRSIFEKYPARSHINFAVWHRFKEEGIVIPYPQMDVHVHAPEAAVQHDTSTQ